VRALGIAAALIGLGVWSACSDGAVAHGGFNNLNVGEYTLRAIKSDFPRCGISDLSHNDCVSRRPRSWDSVPNDGDDGGPTFIEVIRPFRFCLLSRLGRSGLLEEPLKVCNRYAWAALLTEFLLGNKHAAIAGARLWDFSRVYAINSSVRGYQIWVEFHPAIDFCGRRFSDIFYEYSNPNLDLVSAEGHRSAFWDGHSNSYPRSVSSDQRSFEDIGCFSAGVCAGLSRFSTSFARPSSYLGIREASFDKPQLRDEQSSLRESDARQSQGEPGQLPSRIRKRLLGGGMLISAAFFVGSLGLALWAGNNLYCERYFFGAALLLCSWTLLFLSWSAWGPWL
jgi:hypothetical protein